MKIVKKTIKQKETINNLEKFYISKEEGINSFRDYGQRFLIQPINQNKMKVREKDLRY